MAAIIKFPEEAVAWRKNVTQPAKTGNGADVLLFTGVRYSKYERESLAEEFYFNAEHAGD